LCNLSAGFLADSWTKIHKTIRENSRNSRNRFFLRADSRHSQTIFFLFLFAVFSCSKTPTDSRTDTLTGTVLLEGQPVCAARQDHYGITVALYKLAELDTTILRHNREYPNVGFPISQATEFACPPGVWRDHRLGEVVAVSKTNSDGSFKIENMLKGEYNFVALKQCFGWNYLHNVPINTDSNTVRLQSLNNSIYLKYTS